MQRPEFRLVDEYAVRVCDLCAEMCTQPRIATHIGTAGVSDICLPCARAISETLSPSDGLSVCPDCSRSFGGPAALGSHARTHRLATA